MDKKIEKNSKDFTKKEKNKMASLIKKNRKLILENKGNFKYKNRIFIVRWFEKIVRKSKHFFYKLILLLFNNR